MYFYVHGMKGYPMIRGTQPANSIHKRSSHNDMIMYVVQVNYYYYVLAMILPYKYLLVTPWNLVACTIQVTVTKMQKVLKLFGSKTMFLHIFLPA